MTYLFILTPLGQPTECMCETIITGAAYTFSEDKIFSHAHGSAPAVTSFLECSLNTVGSIISSFYPSLLDPLRNKTLQVLLPFTEHLLCTRHSARPTLYETIKWEEAA